jgi:TRAP-type C4-dicarboxylate transport system permease small subunit
MQRAVQTLRRAEDGLLGTLMLALVLIATAQIGRRLLFNDGWVGTETLGRSLVLWIALLGALAATRDGRHVRIDLLQALGRPRLQRLAERFGSALAALFCAGMAWFGLQLVWLERDGGGELLPGLPLWWSVLVIPLGFALMALRFGLCVFWPPTPGPMPTTAGEGGT